MAVLCDLALISEHIVGFKEKYTAFIARIEETHTLKMEAARNSQPLSFIRVC
jgi:hypothetical protein